MRVACSGVVKVARIEVPSASGSEPRVVEVRGGAAKCSCPGFRYRGKCRHVEITELECGWDSKKSAVRQRVGGACPLCGSSTSKVPGWSKANGF